MEKIKILIVAILLMHCNFTLAQPYGCKIPEKIINGKLAVEVDNTKLKSGSFGKINAYFKMPAKSNEVNNADWISCDGFMPNGATIKSIEIVSIEGLPKGLFWNCDRNNRLYKGEETGCLTIQGVTVEKGTHKIIIKLKGKGSLLGIKRNYDCLIKIFEIIVE